MSPSTSGSHERMLSLLSLLQTPRLWSGGELTDRLGVTRRTVRRDVDRLRALGYPVEALRGGGGGYRLRSGTAMPPLVLTDDEAVAVTLGLLGLASQPVAGIAESGLRALAKVDQVLPARLRRRSTTLRAALAGSAPFRRPEPEVAAELLLAVAAAVTNHERLRFAYETSDGTAEARHVEPVAVVPSGRRWCLLAFDLDRDDWRTFRVDRMTDPRGTGARARHTEAPGGDAATFLETRSLATTPVFTAEVSIRADVADLRAWAGIVGGRLIEGSGSHCRWRSAPDTLEWLVLALVRLRHPFTVERPTELAALVAATGERLRAGSSGSASAGTAGEEQPVRGAVAVSADDAGGRGVDQPAADLLR